MWDTPLDRINSRDKERTLTTIVEVISGDSPETLRIMKSLYGSIIIAGGHPTTTINEAEAAKVMKNTLRAFNIALIVSGDLKLGLHWRFKNDLMRHYIFFNSTI
ncbi:hypothetical protein SAMN05216233_1193 [Desulfoluna spongiiphila]|uniref:Uncharacterized protein n=1 Tax=Desulfoluna spongiiphila TaxID=419481 RepID=A0A1G5IBX3_9BACT|nr:hypothetical protein SAMN05216233_1193 [Desulfoluna spongiiphila]